MSDLNIWDMSMICWFELWLRNEIWIWHDDCEVNRKLYLGSEYKMMFEIWIWNDWDMIKKCWFEIWSWDDVCWWNIKE
jgi:hypothetical protein